MQNSVIITGANGGIGKALVETFDDAGYNVIATDVTPRSENLRCNHFIQTNLKHAIEDEAYAVDLFAHIRSDLNGYPLKGLINNAAVQIIGGVEEQSRESWHETLNVNLLAPFFLTQAFLPELTEAMGCVVNIGSIHARLTKRRFVAYATSKAALTGLTRAMAVDLGPRVRVNVIEPAAIETDMLKAGFDGKQELYQQLNDCHPRGSIGQPKQVAKLALMLTEGGMDFLHGACIGLDGGISGRLFDPD
nr:SDR family oxidoreductase [uncultured Cohaesibacter sp.]